jgi:coproporphyrinogen III oxidase
MRSSRVEKAGVNFSEVYGASYPSIEKEHHGKPFFATGVSTITHMYNPYAPIGHMNVRLLEVGDKVWIGGGADLTPMITFEEDTELFHGCLKEACRTVGEQKYEEYRRWCDEYFYIPHHKSVRGVGGIFFDYVELPFDEALAFQKAVCEAYISAFSTILKRRRDLPFTNEEKEKQLYWRGRYAEFNLAYDRGTRFGLMTGGNTEAIFVSLPPEVKW